MENYNNDDSFIGNIPKANIPKANIQEEVNTEPANQEPFVKDAADAANTTEEIAADTQEQKNINTNVKKPAIKNENLFRIGKLVVTFLCIGFVMSMIIPNNNRTPVDNTDNGNHTSDSGGDEAENDSFLSGLTNTNADETSMEEKSDDELAGIYEEQVRVIEIELSETAAPASDFSYEVVSGDTETIVITKYNGTAEAVEIPAKIDGKNVCYIGRDAFSENIYLKKVVMPDTILSVDYHAFINCKLLEEVVFSKNLTYIGIGAFENTALTSVSITSDINALRKIDGSAFQNCVSLQTVEIKTDEYTALDLQDNAFQNCTALNQIMISGERLQRIDMNENVFNTCTSLTSIPFGDKIYSLDRWAFANCTSLADITLPNAEVIPREAFVNCESLTTFTISDSVKGIHNAAFKNCKSLSTVTFEEVTLGAAEEGYGLGNEAFCNTAITEIEIPGAYASIGERAFAACPQLTKFVWHNSGKNVENQFLNDHAFTESYQLKEIYLPRTLGAIDPQDISTMSSCTIYAMSGSVPHAFATENNLSWSEWTE